MKLDRWQLAQIFHAHASTIGGPWCREGLAVAVVEPGGPGRPARYDAKRAIEWFNANKARAHHMAPLTLKDVRAAIRTTTKEISHDMVHSSSTGQRR